MKHREVSEAFDIVVDKKEIALPTKVRSDKMGCRRKASTIAPKTNFTMASRIARRSPTKRQRLCLPR